MNPADANATRQREDELLICCSRVSLGPEMQSRIEQLLHEPLDWPTVLKRAWWHRIRPLTYAHLRAQAAGLVPVEVLEELAGHTRELAERNQRLSRELGEVTAMFEHSALRVLVYKGPPLTIDAYGDLNHRECGDIDLLVHRDDVPQTMEMLQAGGFTFVKGIQDSGECDLRRNGTTLDVHWELAPWWLKYEVNFDRLWERGLTLPGSSGYVRKLRPEDSIVVLSIHGTKHWWERLRWICDVAELVNSGKVTDWEGVKAEAAQTRSGRSVSLGLWLAADILSARLPEEIRQELECSTAVRRLANQFGVWLGHGEHVEEARRFHERLRFRMLVNDRVRDRVPQMGRTLLARLFWGLGRSR